MPGVLSDALAWLVVLAFLVGTLSVSRRRRFGRLLTVGAWGLFALFWLQLFPHFAFVHKSYIEGALTLAAVPGSLYAGWLLYHGRDTLFTLSQAVAVMGVLYLPFETIPPLTLGGVSVPAPREFLIETVAAQTAWAMRLLGHSPTLIVGEQGYLNTFHWVYVDGHVIQFSIILACTGLGSIAIFVGLISAVDAPLRRKARALAIAVPVIYGLNLLRTTFIGLVFGHQYMQWAVDEVLFMFGATDPYLVSFFLSDRVVSQVLAVVALVGITYLVVRELPELLTVVEDVLYMVTNEEYDLGEALNLPRERTVTDGGSQR